MTKPEKPRAAARLLALAFWLPGAHAAAVEDTNLDTRLDVENGRVVVRWSQRGFDYYDVRWSIDGGVVQQQKRGGDEAFLQLSEFRPGAVYRAAVAGCEAHFAAKSRCTEWREAVCGAAGQPCAATPAQKSR